MHKNLMYFLGVLLLTITAAEAQVVPKLPTLPDGKWTGYYAVYTHPLFDATIKPDGVLWIQPKNADGKPVGTPFICYRGHGVYTGDDKHLHWRYTKSFKDPEPPVLWEATELSKSKEKAKTIHLRGLLQDNVEFEMLYEFRGNQIVASGGCVDPAGLQPPSRFWITSKMTPSHSIKPNVEQAERKKILKDCVLLVRMKVGSLMKRLEFHYSDVMNFPGNQNKGGFGAVKSVGRTVRALSRCKPSAMMNMCVFGTTRATALGRASSFIRRCLRARLILNRTK